jgi:hypothetical protein
MALDDVTDRPHRIVGSFEKAGVEYAFRDQDRVPLRDLIDVGLIDRDLVSSLLLELASRLDALLREASA